MTTTIDEFRHAWHREMERLRVIEEKVGGAWIAHARGEGPQPTQDLLDELSAARCECEDRLLAVLAAMGLEEQPLPEVTDGETPPAAVHRRAARASGGT